jgi:hypothetical protein
MFNVAALFVETAGVYYTLPDVDPWDINRDAKLYQGPHVVVAHPPCERWGRYWSGGPSAKNRRIKGDDDGCFASALASVEKWGGVLEHPEASHAWDHFGLSKPPRGGGWVQTRVGWTCCVEQGNYGHPARKATWLYAVTKEKPADLVWSLSTGRRLDEGFHSSEERRAARAAGVRPVGRLSKKERLGTPRPFAKVLINIARNAR